MFIHETMCALFLTHSKIDNKSKKKLNTISACLTHKSPSGMKHAQLHRETICMAVIHIQKFKRSHNT